jgi:hypothetical protein
MSKLILLACLMLAGCVVIQTVPERAPDARVILEQRQAQPVRGGS